MVFSFFTRDSRLAAHDWLRLYAPLRQARQRGLRQDLFQLVAIENIPNRDGQYLRNALIDRFYRAGRPADPQYGLLITNLETRRTDLDLTQSASSTREQMRLKADLQLRDKITGEVLLQRRLSATASYNVLESEFATRVSREEARDNLTLASQIEAQLALYFQRAEKPATP
ncbi:MAG TPA: LPS assembly lipoprotein LptE [Alphaproteobacteria bacterium]|nr:LPS assembly lipoprotein LptE [Alphaproteobacteria bacterium]